MTTTHRGLPVSHLTDFVGRDAELRTLRKLVSSRRLVTITGQAGVGKSRTAVRLADILRRSLGGSTALISMAGRNADALGAAIGEAIGSAGSAVSEIVRALGDRPHLLIIDDLDDAVAAGQLLEELLRSTVETRILVAARGRTGIDGETPYTLGPLEVPSAAAYHATDSVTQSPTYELLVGRVLNSDPSFDLSDAPTDDLVTVCRATDGLPRFIEAAARAVCALGIRETAAAAAEDPTVLDSFLNPGAGGMTSRAVLDADMSRLSGSARQLVRRLALLESGADLRFAAEVFADGRLARIASAAAELVDHSLVQSSTVGGERRLRVPLMYRHHLRADWDDDDRVRDERAVHDALLRHLRHSASTWFSPDQLAGIQFLNRHAADITALLGAMSTEPENAHEALEVISSLRYYWQLHPVDPWPRARDWLETALSLDVEQDAVTLRAMLTDAYIAFHEGDLHGARAQLRAVRTDLDADIADNADTIFAVFVEALVSLAEGDLVRAETDLSRVLGDSLELDAREHLGEKYWHLAACQIAAGKQDEALTTLADGLSYCERVGDVWGRAYMWCLLALIADREGSHADAVQRVRESVDVMAKFGDRVGLALCVQLLAAFSARHGEASSVTQLEDIVERSTLARPPVPLPELTRGRPQRIGPAAPLPDDLSLSVMLSRIIDGDDSPLDEPARVESSGVLSARETEIAALVAEGLGNPAIAARLVLSRRTVEGHVQRILAKLGFRSRSQIAVWATQHVTSVADAKS